MVNSVVEGKVRVTGGQTVIASSYLPAGDGSINNRIIINDAAEDTVVGENTITGGSIVVGRTGTVGIETVVIQDNIVTNGDIKCRGDAANNTIAFRNKVPNGKITCPHL